MLAVTCAIAQPVLPELAQIKIAADAGDPVAQTQMAERDPAHAETWYRKAANQGYVHAQGKLGNLLLMRYGMTFGLKPEARAALGQEALKWVGLAASQGDKQGEANLASICLEGKLVKQDLIAAYKWGELATRGGGGMINFEAISGQSTRDAAILKMNADQIAKARKQVDEFVPHQPKPADLPDAAWIQKIKLNGISGGPMKYFANIGSVTLERGERGTVKVDGKAVVIQCLEITDSTATISIEGVEGNRTLKLN